MNILTSFARKHLLPDTFIMMADQYYVPIVERLIRSQSRQNKPLFVGINGCQGSGKSTLAAFFDYYITQSTPLNVVVMSLDDFYYANKERQQLAKQVHPLLATRGVPGTHNVKLLSEILSALNQQSTNITIPRFNKAQDEPEAPFNWTVVEQPADIVIMEGWCWGTTPQQQAELTTPINALEQAHDQDGSWRQYVNRQLAQLYLPLYDLMHHWIYLQAPSFDCVYRWRLQQEHQLKKRSTGKNKVMSDAQIADFISYFQRLTEHSFTCMPSIAHDVITLTPERTVASSYKGVATQG